MKVWIRRALILSGLGACAFAGGVALGNFTARGLGGPDQPVNEMAALQAFLNEEDARRATQQARLARPIAAPEDRSPARHICQGCDAQLYKDSQLAALAAAGAGDSALAPDAYAQAAD